jgi:RimJ/RimL family protein N-acetyltransferase
MNSGSAEVEAASRRTRGVFRDGPSTSSVPPQHERSKSGPPASSEAGTPDLQPTLTGDTIELRPTVPDDWHALYAVASDPDIWAVHPAHDRWQEPVFRRYFEEALASRGSLTIRERESGRVIGASRYYNAYAGPGEVEIGWTFLARDHWGGTINRELKDLMLRHAFRWFDPVIFVVGKDNLRSRRAMEKIGGVLRPETQYRDMAGRSESHVVYAIRKADW